MQPFISRDEMSKFTEKVAIVTGVVKWPGPGAYYIFAMKSHFPGNALSPQGVKFFR
ncbi:MAG: hypothetical protein ACJAU6_003629 [Alphaproteobacteria bacterium]|jgi:hypothetical protein